VVVCPQNAPIDTNALFEAVVNDYDINVDRKRAVNYNGTLNMDLYNPFIPSTLKEIYKSHYKKFRKTIRNFDGFGGFKTFFENKNIFRKGKTQQIVSTI